MASGFVRVLGIAVRGENMTEDEEGDKLFELVHDAGFNAVDILIDGGDKGVFSGRGKKKEGEEYSSSHYFVVDDDDVRVATDDEEKTFAKLQQLVNDSGFDRVKILFKDGDKTVYDAKGKQRKDAKYKNICYFIEEYGDVRLPTGEESWDFLEISMKKMIELEKRVKGAGVPDDPAALAHFKEGLKDALTNSVQDEEYEKSKKKPRKKRKSSGTYY